jgi:rSAM/selenodomain-associated transferase 1
MSTALAIFVKTPGLSPIKTRLAAGIGAEHAERFHALAANAVAAVARAAMPLIEPYWAVAEPEALRHPRWDRLPVLCQGAGGLGQRLDTVCSALQARHGRVLLVGADSPQLTVDLLHRAVRVLDAAPTPVVIGRASDGGFWLFGTRVPVPASVWHKPSYSSAHTADQLLAALRPLGAPASLPTLTDVDRAEDLTALAEALQALPAPLPEQQALQTWLRGLPAAMSHKEISA